MQAQIVRLMPREGARSVDIPSYQSEHAAGLDLRACLVDAIEIAPGESALIPTGWCIAIPIGFEGQVRPRSGLALKHRLMVVNSPGTIDADYRGEMKVLLGNFGQAAFRIEHGDRIAQLVIAPVARALIQQVQSLDSTGRGASGYGSTGVA